MPLTKEQVIELKSRQSTYGCGASNCVRCYPIQYACDWCDTEWDNPIANGEDYTCPECNHSVSYLANERG